MRRIIGGKEKIYLPKAKVKFKRKFTLSDLEILELFQKFQQLNCIHLQEDHISLNLLANQNRREIYQIIEEYPGVYPYRISKLLQMNPNQLLYHLTKLEEEKKIQYLEFGSIKAYGTQTVTKQSIKLGYILLKKSMRRIILLLTEHPLGLTENAIVEQIRLSQSTVNYTLRKLRKIDLIMRQAQAKINYYSVNGHLGSIIEEKLQMIKKHDNVLA